MAETVLRRKGLFALDFIRFLTLGSLGGTFSTKLVRKFACDVLTRLVSLVFALENLLQIVLLVNQLSPVKHVSLGHLSFLYFRPFTP